MKKYIFLFILIGLTSCSNEIKKVENPKKETTFEILELERDTTVEVAINGNTVYLLNKETKLVEYRIKKHDTDLMFILMIFYMCVGMLIVFLMDDQI